MNRKHIIRNLRLKGIAFDENLSTQDLNALLTQDAQNRFTRQFNFASGRGKISLTFNSVKADEPAQIMICEDIGKDAWTGEGISVEDVKNALDAITPKTRALNFLIDSPGGSYNTGCAIHNILSQWAGVINKTIIGIAASTASWMIPADTTKAFKNSQIFMHRAMCAPFGNVDDLQAAIDYLTQTDDQIAQMYADQSGNEAAAMLDLMKNETLLTGPEAMKLGLVDEIIDGEATNQFTADWLNSAKQKLAAQNSLSKQAPSPGENQPTPQNQMQKKIALLNKRGITIPENATEAQLDALIAQSDAMRAQNKSILTAWNVTFDDSSTDAAIGALVQNGKPTVAPTPVLPPPSNGMSAEDKALLDNLRNQVVENRRREVRNKLQHLASAEGGHRIPVNSIEGWEEQALAAKDGPDGNPVLNNLGKLPASAPGIAPLNQDPEITGESFADVQKFCLSNGPDFRKKFLGAGAQNVIIDSTLKEIGSRARLVANVIAKHKPMLVAMFNSNTIDSALQRQVILQDMLEAYALQLLPLEAFSVKYENVPLQGNDQLVVPYFPLQSTASTSFVKGTGYTTVSDWTENSRSITIGGDGNSANSGTNATAGTAKDRLFQRIDFTSYDMSRQPYLIVAELAKQAANKLAVDIMTQIYSRVCVTGNFGAVVKNIAAALFSADDIADLSEYADTAQWPQIARSLVLTNTYKTPLLKDNTFKQYLSYGSTDPIRKAQIQEAYGFQDMYFVPALASYLAAKIVGWINHKSAVLVGFAPIMPTPEVRNLLTTYDVVVHPRSGAVLEYRKFGNATTDTTSEVIESSFGAAKGVDAALQLIGTP